MTVYLDKKVIEKNIDAEPSAYVSARSTAGARSLQVGVKPTRNAVRTKASSRWLAVGGTSLLVALCLVMFPMVGRGEGITPVYPLEDIREIVIDASILNVELVPTDNNELGVYWEASDSWDVHVSSEDGVLSIGEDSTIGRTAYATWMKRTRAGN